MTGKEIFNRVEALQFPRVFTIGMIDTAIAQAVAEKTELIQRLADEKCRCFLERATKAEAMERQRCATILREHICNYCDHDHAEDMAQLVLEGKP